MKYMILALLMSSTSLMAGQFNTSYGKIVHVRSYGEYNPNMPTFIQVAGTAVRETCSHSDWQTGNGDLNYYLVLPSEQHILSIVLAAYMAGKEVKITSNDDVDQKYNGEVCRVGYIDIKP